MTPRSPRPSAAIRGPRSSSRCPASARVLGTEFVAAAGDLVTYADTGCLASAAGLVPVSRDSGRRPGRLYRPEGYNRRLRRVAYPSARTSIIRPGSNRDF
ncbi:transposase [Actinomadura sp. NAK00032]|uniref:transposase n=1 Tax=Actinomadura sp. NAK00032 TaxID=2742128 RepID=UPI001C3783B8|nr:transposase [Actinomadura sp. NAK00032]